MLIGLAPDPKQEYEIESARHAGTPILILTARTDVFVEWDGRPVDPFVLDTVGMFMEVAMADSPPASVTHQ